MMVVTLGRNLNGLSDKYIKWSVLFLYQILINCVPSAFSIRKAPSHPQLPLGLKYESAENSNEFHIFRINNIFKCDVKAHWDWI